MRETFEVNTNKQNRLHIHHKKLFREIKLNLNFLLLFYIKYGITIKMVTLVFQNLQKTTQQDFVLNSFKK